MLRASPAAIAILDTQKALFSILPTLFSLQTPTLSITLYFLQILFINGFFLLIFNPTVFLPLSRLSLSLSRPTMEY
jgi:hypothetical protein